MIETRPLPAFATASPAELGELADVLRSADFTAEKAAETVRGMEAKADAGRRLAVLLRRTAGGRPLDTLLRLFVIGVAVDRDAAVAALGGELSRWAELGLVEVDGDRLVALVEIRPYADIVMASDFHRRVAGNLPGDHVMGLSPSTMALAGLTIRRGGEAVLDLGTGCGFQALQAVPHAAFVTGTDLNPRAIAFSHLNAHLNNRPFEALPGDVFEPVAGRRFDLIVSNLPYVISPDHSHFFLHSGLEMDEICRRLAQRAPAYLTETGYCQYLANWPMDAGDQWPERLAGWFEGTGCDAWVLRTDSYPVEDYATTWIETDEDDPGAYPAAFDAWMRFFAAAGIDRIGYGLVTMRPSGDGQERLFLDDGPEDLGLPCGDDLAAGLAMRARLAATDDDALFGWTPVVRDRVQLEQHMRSDGDGWRPVAGKLLRTKGLRHAGIIDSPGARLVARCNGQRTVRQLIEEMAAATGDPFDELAGRALPRLRTLLEQGFLGLPD